MLRCRIVIGKDMFVNEVCDELLLYMAGVRPQVERNSKESCRQYSRMTV